MHRAMTTPRRVSRRTLLRGAAAGATATAAAPLAQGAALATPQVRQRPTRLGSQAGATQTSDPLLRALDEKIEAGMARYRIPGAAVGVWHQGQEYVRGYGVTNVDYPQPVDGDTLFRIASTTKAFTGTTVMRLVEQGRLDLDAPVRRYLPEFRVADKAAAQRVTLRQCLNHSAGWVGTDDEDFGRGEDALAKYVASLAKLPQLTPPGTQFGYNNTAPDVAGRVIEVVTGKPYEQVVQELLLDPLALTRTRFFTDQLAGYPIAGGHSVVDDQAVFTPELWYVPRAGHPDGGLISSARDQLHFARFLMGDGRAPDGTRLLTPAALVAMRSNPGPGGTLGVEIDGFGVSLALRPTAEGIPVVVHGGTWSGQKSAFYFVPERDFAMTLLTNSEGGTQLRAELYYDDWVLQQFVGLHNPPAVPTRLPPERLAEYEGTYVARSVDEAGEWQETVISLRARDGTLQGELEQAGNRQDIGFQFYRGEYVLVLADTSGAPSSARANFVRGADGRVAWLCNGGRLFAHQR
jgi:CubicO group peptidase (beta-lactamase class C family)